MSLLLHSWFAAKTTAKTPKRKLGRLRRRSLCQQLEPRMMLTAAPIAVADPWYSTAQDTALVIGSSDTTLLANDWDPRGLSLTAALVDAPANGSICFDGPTGTFSYSPNTSFVGVDTFTYKASNGTSDSNTVMVSIAVGGHFGPRTNLEEAAQSGQMLAGELELRQPLTPRLSLIYDSGTIPKPIIALETFLQSGSAVPAGISAQLTFNATAGSTYAYDTTGLVAGDNVRFALQADATALASGRYDYSVKLTADMSGTPVTGTRIGIAVGTEGAQYSVVQPTRIGNIYLRGDRQQPIEAYVDFDVNLPWAILYCILHPHIIQR